MNAIKSLFARFAPFEVVKYAREDGNRAVYKIRRWTKEPLLNQNHLVGFKAVKTKNSGTNRSSGWRSFRYDRIIAREPVWF